MFERPPSLAPQTTLMDPAPSRFHIASELETPSSEIIVIEQISKANKGAASKQDQERKNLNKFLYIREQNVLVLFS